MLYHLVFSGRVKGISVSYTHLDSIQWLEDFLVNSAKAVIVISHDSKFVDNITTRTIEVTMGGIYDYKVNYYQYLILRKERREQQMKQYEEQQKMIQETKDFIEPVSYTHLFFGLNCLTILAHSIRAARILATSIK